LSLPTSQRFSYFQLGNAPYCLMRADIRITMPPHPWCFNGIAEIGPLPVAAFGPDRPGDWRLLPTMANRMPTAASYLRAPSDPEFRAFKFDVIWVAGRKVAEVTTFGPELFPAFGCHQRLTTAPLHRRTGCDYFHMWRRTVVPEPVERN
jgi:hypothetical protein